MAEDHQGVEVVASALIVNKRGEILLVKSPKWGGKYLLPGGHVDPGETILEAAKREGEEETGLKLEPRYCVNVGELVNDPSFIRRAHLIFFHIVCEAVTEDVHLDSREALEYVWLKPEASLKLEENRSKQSIENFLKGVHIPLSSKVFP